MLIVCFGSRLLLTRDNSECFQMLMSVVKLVVLASQENFDRERESKIGQS